MLTINELIRIIEDKYSKQQDIKKKDLLASIKKELLEIKNAPELKASCNIDFKLSNSDEYLEKIIDI